MVKKLFFAKKYLCFKLNTSLDVKQYILGGFLSQYLLLLEKNIFLVKIYQKSCLGCVKSEHEFSIQYLVSNISLCRFDFCFFGLPNLV